MNTNDACSRITDLMQTLIPKYTKAVTNGVGSTSVTPSQIEILLLLEENGAMRISDIAKSLNMVDSNVSNICSRLEKANFLNRKREIDDRRVVVVELNENFLSKVLELKRENQILMGRMEDILKKLDIQTIYEGLSQFNVLLDNLLETDVKSQEEIK